ncbi:MULTISPECIES: SAM-dependent methyltransferase [unclassified Streptomyces]|uniref:SAM-dependent methyltransferase n=1 Tax=unclassified Streptomyces TaxID=2593676 RepID=UPI001E174F95|nr:MULTISPECIES: SAM-dependent methyltransferase [unclassified Streptomyces]MBD0708723.1 Nodulation protein S [Streptomyces sp. CBMA291]MBD0714582.1 Nodulation protein S [Streptomyces sp. CBMA370]
MRIVLTGHGGRIIDLPPGPLEKRAGILLREAGPSGPAGPPEVPDRASGWERDAMWWAHNPADWRAPQARSGLLAARAADGRPIRHAVGHAGHSQFVVDRAHPLDGRQLNAKLDALNSLPPHLLAGDGEEQRVTTATVASCERFFGITPRQAEHLYYLLYAPLGEVRVPADPWGLDTSAYERDRLDATRDWVRETLGGTGFTVVEPGACEGALTAPLRATGLTVIPTEPHDEFRRRLSRRLDGADIPPDTVEELAEKHRFPADAYLLAEILYYLDDISVVHGLPTDLLLLTSSPEFIESSVRPWFSGPGGDEWRLTGERTLVAPRMDFLVPGVAYQRKRGSVGLVYRRA